MTNLNVWAARKPYLKIDYLNRFPSRELEEIESEWQSLLNDSMGDRQAPPTAYLERLKFVPNLKLTPSDFCQHPIPSVHEEQIVMKARDKKRQFLRVQVTVNIGEPAIAAIGLYPACRFNASCTSICRNCMLLLVFPLSGEAS